MLPRRSVYFLRHVIVVRQFEVSMMAMGKFRDYVVSGDQGQVVTLEALLLTYSPIVLPFA
jgi:hypothetical protein